jgi:Tfp pilus assembly protein FimV
MEVNSALNQKLDADIPIRLASNEKPHDISVRMASPLLFEKHKISRHSLLDKIQFKRIGTVIQITSNSTIKVPTLDFLLEISGRKGSTYKRYKISFANDAAENRVIAHTIVASQLIPVANIANIQPIASPLATIVDRINKDNTFGPTQKADSLAKISKTIAKLQGINSKIVQSALRHHNPNAFYKGIHGALKSGEYLVIPDFKAPKEEVTAIAPAAIITATPLPTITNVESETIPAPITFSSIPSDINAQFLQSRVEQLEHQVVQIQKELITLKTQALVSPATFAETKTEALSTTTSIPEQDKPSPETLTSTNTPILIMGHNWLLTLLAASLLGLLAWIAMRVINNRRHMNKKSSNNKILKGAFKESNIGLAIPKKATRTAPKRNIPKEDDNNAETPIDDLEFDFFKSQANTTKIKKLNRPSRYPSDIGDNLKK